MKTRLKVLCLIFSCLIAASISCIGSLDEMQIVDAPVFVCPTPNPQPDPTLRPYVIRPPQLFYVDNAVFAGGFESSLQVRFRLRDWTTLPATSSASGDPRNITLWGVLYPILTDEQRQQSVSMASASQGRLLMAWPLVLFGVAEQAVYLLLTIAQGITFISFGVAILFAFFKKTEVIARSIVDQWIELIVQTVIIALMQSLVVAFFLAGTASGNGMVVLGIGLICLVFIVITLWSGIKAVWNSINRLFYSMGQATGGTIASPATAAALAAAGGAAVVGGVVSIGANSLAGATALSQGATLAQAAGSAVGGIPQLSGAARTLAYLPGVRGTSLGETAEQFTEGAVTRQVARHIPFVGRATGPILGTALLTNRDPDAALYDEQDRVIARPMLVPAVGDALGSWATPKGKRRKTSNSLSDLDMLETEDGELIPAASTRPHRMGTFTPIPQPSPDHREAEIEHARQKSNYAAEMQGEEMEQHISDTLRSSQDSNPPANEPTRNAEADGSSKLDQVAARLEESAEALTGPARLQMTTQTAVGHLRLSGSADVASVLGDVVRQTQLERVAKGEPVAGGLDHFSVADRMAQVMGITPIDDAKPPIQENLTRFGLFADLALRLGLSPEQAEQVIREVKESPSGELKPETRQTLIEQVRQDHHFSWDDAEQSLNRLQNFGLALPEQIIAFGQMNVALPVVKTPEIDSPIINFSVTISDTDVLDQASKGASAMEGSQNVLGGVS